VNADYCDRCGSGILPSPPAEHYGRFFGLESSEEMRSKNGPWSTEGLPAGLGLPGTLVGRKSAFMHICEACYASLVRWLATP
jgi:hypothetical protein